MKGVLTTTVIVFNVLVMTYALVVAISQLTLVGGAAVNLRRELRRNLSSRKEDLFAHPDTPGLSVLVPAFNESPMIAECLRSVVDQRYPEFEVIVVDDGSTDDTFDLLRDAFNLVPTTRVIPQDVPTIGRIREMHSPKGGGNLLVIRKENAGRCADALNTALNAARYPLICTLDADSVLEPDALLHIARPLVEQPDDVVAAGGVVRPSNGMVLRRGTIESVTLPRRLIVRAQIVEYLRAFMLGRIGWSWLNSVLIISGAFGAFRREDVVALGGLHPESLGQDADLVASLHHMLRRQKRKDYKVVIVPQAVCWSEAPQHRRDLRRQRRRWAHGLGQVLWHQRSAMLRPRFGRFGLLVLPYHVVFEMLGPVVEVLGLPAVLAAWWLGLLNPLYALTVFAMAIGFGMLVSLSAVLVDEVSERHYDRWRDLGALILAALWETTALRVMMSWWRVQGLTDAMRRRRSAWASMPRVGFSRAH
ncbi:MAG: glycosyltransferase family 2 protein [Kineosporiaceae bacterium]|nr:glycosyltransferase family 2 protein [Kineosporiaceae bacterium]